MIRTAKRLGIVAGVFLLVVGIVLVVNQTAQLIALLDRVHPILGSVALWGLLVVYGVCFVVPILLLLRLPSPLLPPDTDDEGTIAKYRDRLSARMERNSLVRAEFADQQTDLDSALALLDRHADDVIRRASSRVFLSTAVSQFGSLSSLLVLAAQVKMVWDVAHIYHQRPPLRQMLALYVNVAATAFVAGRLEDIDMAEQLEPVVSSALGSVAGVIPGFQAASDLFVNAVFVGSTNAFLSLRVGVITKRYCGSVVRPDRGGLWRSATVDAVAMLRGIVVGGAKSISGAFLTASSRAVGGAARGVGTAVRGAGVSIARGLRFSARDVPGGEDPGHAPGGSPKGST